MHRAEKLIGDLQWTRSQLLESTMLVSSIQTGCERDERGDLSLRERRMHTQAPGEERENRRLSRTATRLMKHFSVVQLDREVSVMGRRSSSHLF